ncbi:13416_t:CDS:2, partial [Acaulospora morrowiae]
MAKILKCPDCNRPILTGKTRDLNKHMNLNENLRKGQCLPALCLMQNPVPASLENQIPAPEGNLISFDENPLTAYKRINDELEAIAEKTNDRIDMCKSGNYTLTSIKLFKETTLAPLKKKYEREAIQYDVNLMYIYEMLKKEASWPVVSDYDGQEPPHTYYAKLRAINETVRPLGVDTFNATKRANIMKSKMTGRFFPVPAQNPYNANANIVTEAE